MDFCKKIIDQGISLDFEKIETRNNFKIFSTTLLLLLILSCSFTGSLQAQQIKVLIETSKLKLTKDGGLQNNPIRLGVDNYDEEAGVNGVSFKINFDSTLIYADSVHITADGNLLELDRGEYLEMYRRDSTFVVYSLSAKGKAQELNMDVMPVLVDFKIKEKAYYELIASNCDYNMSFSVEGFKTYNLGGLNFNIDSFAMPLDVNCGGEEEEKFQKPLRASPNPTSRLFWVNIPEKRKDKIADMRLYDMRGEVMAVDTEILENGQIRVDLNGLRFGQYFLNIIYNDGTRNTAKVILMNLDR